MFITAKTLVSTLAKTISQVAACLKGQLPSCLVIGREIAGEEGRRQRRVASIDSGSTLDHKGAKKGKNGVISKLNNKRAAVLLKYGGPDKGWILDG